MSAEDGLDFLTPEQRTDAEHLEAGTYDEAELEPADLDVRRPLGKVVPVRMSDEQWRALRREADELGLRPSTMLRLWVLERLRAVQRGRGEPAENVLGADAVIGVTAIEPLVPARRAARGGRG